MQPSEKQVPARKASANVERESARRATSASPLPRSAGSSPRRNAAAAALAALVMAACSSGSGHDGSGSVTGSPGDASSLGATTCNSGYTLFGGQCNANQQSCTVANGAGTQTFASGTYGVCQPTTCNSGYTLFGGQCNANQQSCTVANGTGTQSFSNGSYGSCSAISCNSGYHLSGGDCLAFNVTLPSIDLTPNVYITPNNFTVGNGQSAVLSWFTTSATSCVASGGWSGTQPVAGSYTTAALTSSTTFTISCNGPGGTTTASAVVAVPTGQVFYISPSGNDNNAGTLASPFLTITRGAANLQAGGILYVRGGTYYPIAQEWQGNYSGTLTNPITIMGCSVSPASSGCSGDGEAIFDGSDFTLTSNLNWSNLVEVDGNYVNIVGLEMQSFNLSGTVSEVRGLSLFGVGSTANNIIVHDIGGGGIWLNNSNETMQGSTVYRVGLINCRLSTPEDCGLNPGATYNIFSGNSAWPGCTVAAISYTGTEGSNFLYKNNTVHDSWCEGVMIYNASNSAMIGNVAYNNWAANIYGENIQNVVVANNISYVSQDDFMTAAAIATGAPSRFGQITLSDEQSHLSNNNIFLNNFVFNSPVSFYGWTEQAGSGLVNDVIANNTFVGGIFSTGGSSQSVVNSNSIIVNNIIDTSSVSVPTAAGITFAGNLWLTTPPSTAMGPGSVIGDPLLSTTGGTSAGQLAAGYFSLTPSSPAIGAGISLPEVTTNFFGTLRSDPPNIGGY